MRGFPGRELSLDPGRSKFERLYANLLGAPANGLRIRLRRVLPATAGSYRTILDAGCGSGVFSFELAKRHPEAQVTGVELEPELVARANEIARRAHLANCRFQQGDVTKLDFDDEFDLVTATEVLEHVSDPELVLTEMARVARGYLLVSVPREPLWRALNVVRGAYVRELGNTPGHLNHWSRGAFEALLGRFGMVVATRSPFPWTMLLVQVG